MIHCTGSFVIGCEYYLIGLFVCFFVIFVIGSLEILMTHYLLSRVWDLCDPPFVAFVIFVISAQKKEEIRKK